MHLRSSNLKDRKMLFPGTRVGKRQSWIRHFRYLLLVPILVAVGYGSYRYGKQSVERHMERSRRESWGSFTSSPDTPSAGGATYVRWGRNVCPIDAELVYNGVVGGSLYSSTGGGSNYLCLPNEPQWGMYNESVEKTSKIYGAEYQYPSTLKQDNVEGRPLLDNNVPCAVCRSLTKSTVIMIPARIKCYEEWNEQYHGYLMSADNAAAGRTQFVCMDESPEADPAGFRDEDAAVFYQVEGVCGSLPCPLYFPRREIPCVVCGK